MTVTPTTSPLATGRAAGLLYLVIIVLGIWSEIVVRGPILVAGDAVATAANVTAAEGLFRLSLGADAIMASADIALAVLLFVLLRPVDATLALMAMVFRLIQAATIGTNLLNQQAVLLILGDSGAAPADQQTAALATLWLDLQSHGYDLGLIFFGVNSLITGYLLVRSGWLPRAIGWGIAAAGAVYLTGSFLRFLAPAASEAFQPVYLVSLVAELAFALWLVARGLGPRATHGR